MSRLSENERQVFAHAQLQAGATVPEIARQSGLRDHAVRYALNSLIERGAVWYVPYIDVGRLGFSDCCVYFNHLSSSKGSRERLLKAIKESPSVGYFAELAGEYQYTVAIYCRRVHEVEDFFTRLARVSDGAILDRSIATRLSWSFYSALYWAKRPPRARMLQCSAEGKLFMPDDIDHRILHTLSRSSQYHLRQIAKTLRLPLSTVEYRIRKLEDNGVILGHSYKLAPPYFGLSKYRVLVSQARPTRDLRDKLLRFSAKQKYVSSFVHCVGNWDFELSIDLEQPADLPDILEEISICGAGDIFRLKVLNLLTHHKVRLYPFDSAAQVI
ncbi:MAG: Lrp/AsnC family transcriptional regulator [Bdellovibrionota bacterium]